MIGQNCNAAISAAAGAASVETLNQLVTANPQARGTYLLAAKCQVISNTRIADWARSALREERADLFMQIHLSAIPQ